MLEAAPAPSPRRPHASGENKFPTYTTISECVWWLLRRMWLLILSSLVFRCTQKTDRNKGCCSCCAAPPGPAAAVVTSLLLTLAAAFLAICRATSLSEGAHDHRKALTHYPTSFNCQDNCK